MNITIEAGKIQKNYWRHVWQYREIFYILVWRSITTRYRQSFAGILWAIFQPLIRTVTLVVVFGILVRFPSEGIPYSIFFLTALLPWIFFTTGFSTISNSIVGSAGIISKIYFPRIIIPLSSIAVATVDFVISLIILACILLWLQYPVDWHILAIPFFFILCCFITLGAGLLFASVNVKYRDFRLLTPLITQLGLFITPILYSVTIIPDKYKIFYYLNPMVAVIDGFRWSISKGDTSLSLTELAFSITIAIILMTAGIIVFKKMENRFVDIL